RLVARLLDAPLPAPEARILAEGRIAGLALLGQNANWLADHSYQQADLGLRHGENRAFFGGADFASVRIDTGSNVDYKGYTVVAGEAVKREKEDQSLLIGGFFEGGYGEYDVHGKFGHPSHPNMKGEGTMNYYGIGLMVRQRWDKGFRLEGSLRGGRQENRFRSRDLDDVDGEFAKYKLDVPWFGAHLGAGYEWQADEHNGFDTFLRYYWVRQNGKTVHLNKGRERVRFMDDNSHRLRAGGRYTRTKDVHSAWYLGLAYEYEFDHRAHARSIDGEIDVPDPRGSSFVGEIGMVLHPKDHDRFSIEFGLQGYAGKREGVSGGARLGWKF
ncbi:MAG: autotransporter domain-containing protein, partial [Azoarcus sp.]|nr:autotransporter domain-containing protein [Azoarcus sp.]